MKYFLVGIKGTGMSALAQCLKDLGELVIGSDKDDHYFTEVNLKKNKIPYFKFNINNIEKYNKYIFVISYLKYPKLIERDEENIDACFRFGDDALCECKYSVHYHCAGDIDR